MNHQDRPIEWAVVGMGRAGRARLRCLSEHAGADAAIQCSRRDPEHPTFDAVLKDETILGVFICRESSSHPDDVRRALNAGKHVLVEYPLAFTESEGRDLYALARKNQCVLHVGFLGLLSGWASAVKTMLSHKQPNSAVFRFQAGFGAVPQADVRNARLGTMTLSRIQQLIVWFGQLHVETCTASQNDNGVVVDITFRSASGQVITLSESRLLNQKRTRALALYNSDGASIDVPDWYGDPGVFSMDTACFMDRCFGRVSKGNWINEEAVLHGLGLAEAISKTLSSIDE